ncbi:hypothetical protein D9M72_553160 [compost metagenome]
MYGDADCTTAEIRDEHAEARVIAKPVFDEIRFGHEKFVDVTFEDCKAAHQLQHISHVVAFEGADGEG